MRFPNPKEIHAIRNEDGTYAVTVKTETYNGNGDFAGMTVSEIPRFRITEINGVALSADRMEANHD